MICFSFQKLFMFPLLKIISTLPNDTILNNSKSILEVNYDSKTGFIKIGANEKKLFNGPNSKDLSQGGEAEINWTSRTVFLKEDHLLQNHLDCLLEMQSSGPQFQLLKSESLGAGPRNLHCEHLPQGQWCILMSRTSTLRSGPMPADPSLCGLSLSKETKNRTLSPC